jgi:deoxyribodipyrimidine photo-lyase
MSTAIALFTRDLRVHDNPALAAAAESADLVVPLFVLDEAILRLDYNRPNRARFLAESLADLDGSLRDRGAGLVVRRGDVVDEVAKLADDVGAGQIHLATDVSGYAQRRQQRLQQRLDAAGRQLCLHDASVTVVPPGEVTASGKDFMAVFTPYHRKWERQRRRDPLPPPNRIGLPRVARGRVPTQQDICPGETSPDLLPGGESAGRQRLDDWLRDGVRGYADRNDGLATDATSRLSSYLHFGCLSATEVVHRAGDSASAPAFVRQVCWRDFHHQVLAARPTAVTADYRSRGDRWRRDDGAFTAWQEGRTGYPVVDAGMRQLAREGWMHNRARLIVGHFLCKTLYVDWRLGARHFFDLLIDGDMANNTMNWQWVAGTGTDSRFNRIMNPVTQGRRHDPDGDYVRRYVPELAEVVGPSVHQPWVLPVELRRHLDYPDPIVDFAEATEEFLRARGKR